MNMKVRIIKSSPISWYFNKIGETFSVHVKNGVYYLDNSEYAEPDESKRITNKFILKTDCELLTPNI